MPRRGYSNTLEAPVVQYIPGFNEDIAQAQLGQLAGVNKKWDETEQAVSNAIAEYGALPVRDTEAPIVKQKIADFNKYVQDTVGKYGGRYDLAAGDIARKMANESSFYSKAKQVYDQQKQYEPLYAKYAQNLLFKGQDPRKQAAFDEEGNFVGTPDFTPYERSDYDRLIQEGVVSGIDKISKETGLSKSKIFGFLEQAKLQGLAALPDGDLKERVKSFLPQFIAESTVGFDPNMKDQNIEKYVLGRAASLAGSGIDRQYEADWLARENYRASLDRQSSGQNLSDIYVFGPGSQDVQESTGLAPDVPLSKALNLKIPMPPTAGGRENYSNIKEAIKDIERISKTEIPMLKDQIKNSIDPIANAARRNRISSLKEQLNTLKDLDPILEKNRELYKKKKGTYPTNDAQLANFIDSDTEAVKKEFTYTKPILNTLTSKMLKTTVKEMVNPNFRIGNDAIVGTSLTDVANQLDVDESVLRGTLDSEEFAPRYNRTTGEYYVNIPTKAEVKNGKLSPNSNTSYKRLYFSPDDLTMQYSLGLKSIKEAIANKKNSAIFDPPQDRFSYSYAPQPGASASDKNASVINVTDKQTGGTYQMSITDLENHIERINEVNLKKEYTYKWMNQSQQRKSEYAGE